MPVTSRYDATENRSVREDTLFAGQKMLRQRVTLAQLNAGFTLLPAIPGFIYSLFDAVCVAVGGAATTGTSVNIIGTRAAAPVQLLVVAVAALTQSSHVRSGAANAVVLADGGSWAPLDVNTPITVITVGAAMTVMTNLDVLLEYGLVPA